MLGVFFSKCPFCKKHVKSDATACPHCGRALVEPVVDVSSSVAARLTILEDLKAKGLISDKEYASRRESLLAEI